MDNPAAFPIIETAPNGSQSIETGMSLRDYFAAKAMQAFIQASAVMGIETRDEKIAEWAYGQADAMLAERERGGEE